MTISTGGNRYIGTLYAASDNELHTDTSEETNTGADGLYDMKKLYVIPALVLAGSTLRLKVEIKHVTAAGTVAFIVFPNKLTGEEQGADAYQDNAFIVDKNTTTTSYVEHIFDCEGLGAGDCVGLGITSGSAGTRYVQNFKICGTGTAKQGNDAPGW